MAETTDGTTTRQAEIERKFEVPERWMFPRLAGLGPIASVGAPRRWTQTATYVDTPSLDLLRAKHTLRRRVGGTDAGWHLKTPGDGDLRTEIHAPLGESAVFVPAELRAEVARIVGQSPLVPVATLKTRRTERLLKDADGTVLAEVVDDAVDATVMLGVGGAAGIGAEARELHWREIEVELTEDAPEGLLDILTDALVTVGLRRSASKSKLAHALADTLSALDGRPTAGDVVSAYLATQVGILQSSVPALRADAKDAVHKARVATRRLRSAFRTYGPLLDASVVGPLGDEVKWLTGVLGEPRDAEVMKARLLRLIDGVEPEYVVGPVRARLERTLESTHADAHGRLVEVLDSPRYTALVANLLDLVARPPYTDAADDDPADALRPLVGDTNEVVVKTAAKAEASSPAKRDERIHDVRKRAKAARYAVELAGKHAGGKAGKAVDRWTDLQEALGDVQDSAVARSVILDIADQARAAGEDTFTYGVMVEREASAARIVMTKYEALLHAALGRSKKG